MYASSSVPFPLSCQLKMKSYDQPSDSAALLVVVVMMAHYGHTYIIIKETILATYIMSILYIASCTPHESHWSFYYFLPYTHTKQQEQQQEDLSLSDHFFLPEKRNKNSCCFLYIILCACAHISQYYLDNAIAITAALMSRNGSVLCCFSEWFWSVDSLHSVDMNGISLSFTFPSCVCICAIRKGWWQKSFTGTTEFAIFLSLHTFHITSLLLLQIFKGKLFFSNDHRKKASFSRRRAEIRQ